MALIKKITLHGIYGPSEGSYSVSGAFDTNENKELVRVYGEIQEGGQNVGNFDANRNGGPSARLVYNYSNIYDNTKMDAISAAVEAAVGQLETELASE